MLAENDELADDEEEILVYVEFDGSIAGNTFSNEKLHLDMIGLDKEHPIMQVNGKFYEGTYQDAVGTYLFFEKDKNPHVDDPVFDTVPSLKYCAKTRKVLKMRRIFVEPKIEVLGDSNDTASLPNMETVRKAGVPPKYQDAALKSWETLRNQRMDALNKYLERQHVRKEKRAQGIEVDSESDNDNPFSIFKHNGDEKNTESCENKPNSIEEQPHSMDCEDADSHLRNSKDNRQGLNIIDPGPSTSKDTQPWDNLSAVETNNSNSDSQETSNAILLDAISKSRATIKTVKKGKVMKKATEASPPKKRKQIRKSDEKTDAEWKESNEIDEDQSAELLSKDLESLLEIDPNDSNTTTEVPTELPESASDHNLDESKQSEAINDKRKLERQQKREEKMRLISERFKKVAEETKLKVQQ